MLDIKLLRETPETLVQNLVDRRVVVFDDLTPDVDGWAQRTIERLRELDGAWRSSQAAVEDVRRRQNANAARWRPWSKSWCWSTPGSMACRPKHLSQRPTRGAFRDEMSVVEAHLR